MAGSFGDEKTAEHLPCCLHAHGRFCKSQRPSYSTAAIRFAARHLVDSGLPEPMSFDDVAAVHTPEVDDRDYETAAATEP